MPSNSNTEIMKWSKYNHIMECKYGIFIYNSITNSFLKISQYIRDLIQQTENWSEEIEKLDIELKKVLISNQILVEDDFDKKYLTKLQFVHRRSAFANSRLMLTIATTTDCNFKCPYCYEEGITDIRMDEETEKAIISYIDSIKPRTLNITWYGGEPLMNFKTIERLTGSIDKLSYIEDLHYDIVTNGSLLTEKVCRFFAAHNLESAQVTIDGLEENHNKSRISKNGRPSYSLILSNLDRAIEMLPNCHFSVRVNIGLSNKEDYPKLYQELHDRYKGKNNFMMYFDFVEDYNMCGGASILNSGEKIEFMRYLSNVHHIYKNTYPIRENSLCMACIINSYVIAPNGDLYKCWNEIGRKNFVVGNIKNKKIVHNYDLISEYAVTYNKFNDSKCLNCFLLPVCEGGCPSNRYNYQIGNSNLEICPYNLENIDLSLELMYERVHALSKSISSKSMHE